MSRKGCGCFGERASLELEGALFSFGEACSDDAIKSGESAPDASGLRGKASAEFPSPDNTEGVGSPGVTGTPGVESTLEGVRETMRPFFTSPGFGVVG